MALKGLFFSKSAPQKPAPTGSKPKGPGERRLVPATQGGMESLFLEPLALSPELELRLGEAAEAGRAHFDKYNQNRLELAFGSFDGAMKEALFDIIYLLHVNDSSLSEITYATTELVDFKEKQVENRANLFVEGAPFGVAGLEDLPPVIKEPFLAHVSKTFGVKGVAANNPNPVIQAIFSIGSIGTVGHKHLASDLDLQILYRLEPFLVPKEELTTEAVKGMVAATLKSLFKQLQRQNKVSVEQLTQNPNLAGKINEMARRKFAQGFPLLNLQFIKKELDLMEDLTPLLHKLARPRPPADWAWSPRSSIMWPNGTLPPKSTSSPCPMRT